MKSKRDIDHRPLPTLDQVVALLAFLPGFEGRDEPYAIWAGGERDEESKTITMPYPRYANDVSAIFRILAEPQWVHKGYSTDRTHEFVNDVKMIEAATMDEVTAVLTWCWRGERFCDGHMEMMLKNGVVQAALRRLQVLFPETSFNS